MWYFQKTTVTAAKMEPRVKVVGLCLGLQVGTWWCIKGRNVNSWFLGTLECLCGMGCKRDFPFQSRNECEAQLIGKFRGLMNLNKIGLFLEGSSGKDVCSTSPCSNSGQCIQLKYGGYRCDCTGTGYYGDYCQKSKYCENSFVPNYKHIFFFRMLWLVW